MDGDKEKVIAELIIKVRFGTATGEERRIVNDWLKASDDHRLLYEKVVSGNGIKERLEREMKIHDGMDVKKISDRVRRQVENHRVRRKRRFILWASVVGAACFVGIIFTSLLFTGPTSSSLTVATAGTPEAVVNDKVMLILPGGESIGLTTASDSIKFGRSTIIKKNDQLSYEVESQERLDVSMEEELNKVVTGVGGEYSLILSDGTRVWLNAGTELEFPVCFVKDERVVKLRGEAYFEVKPDSTRPFLVETKDIRTRVLGTSFNIKAYENEENIFTTLLTGKVEVTALNENCKPVVLTPGMQSEWRKESGEMVVKEVMAENFVAWKQGVFLFDNEDITVVTRLLERWYGVTFVYQQESSRKHTFSGNLSKDESLASILETFTFTGGPHFKVENNIVYIIDRK